MNELFDHIVDPDTLEPDSRKVSSRTVPDSNKPDMTVIQAFGFMQAQGRKLRAARYVFHKVTVHRYALAVVRGEMGIDEAKARYSEAMRNYDEIISHAPAGVSEHGNEIELAKGYEAISETLDAIKRDAEIRANEELLNETRVPGDDGLYHEPKVTNG